ncbi:MAG: chromosome partitioning protein ParA [Mycobacterium sp.]|nr:MAG: chromosome partitioning protein ParA [Mycobacterium sp.]
MIERDDISSLVGRMWTIHREDLTKFDRINGYVKGELGMPVVPDNADDEVKEIRRICVYNVLTLVLDAFVQNLSVVGYHNADAQENSAGWRLWQYNQMDARQAEIYSAAAKYGVSYVVVEPGKDYPIFRPRSPRQLIATYSDPQVDRWPEYALETWIDTTNAEPRRRGLLIDDTHMWPLDLGPLTPPGQQDSDGQARKVIFELNTSGIGEPMEHGATWNGSPVCPVIRYVNRRDSEDLVDGEIERLIKEQKAINEVNFDRLIVGRFGAFPQTVLTRWESMPEDVNQVLKASMRRVWAFDEDVQATRLPAASVDGYNALIEALEVHTALRAQISPASITGKMVNLSAEALAAAEANQQRKLAAMRESHGESHEQLLQLGVVMHGEGVALADDEAEVVWRDTEARSFAAIVDGITKIGQALKAGYPIEPLLPLVPGLTQQMIIAIKAQAAQMQDQAQQSSITDLVSSLRNAANGANQDPQVAALASRTRPGATPPAPAAPEAAPPMGQLVG